MPCLATVRSGGNTARTLLLAVLLASCSLAAEPSPTPAPADLAAILLRPGLWTTKGAEMADTLEKDGFRWVSKERTALRSDAPATFVGNDVYETLVRLDDDVPTGAVLFFFIRGVSPGVNFGAFERLIDRAKAGLTAKLGIEPTEIDPRKGAVVKAEGLRWRTAESDFVLEWSSTGNPSGKLGDWRPEFIRLTVGPKSDAIRPIGADIEGNREAMKSFAGTDHVRRGEWGVKLDGIPMVDQGEKGYCVVASVERVLRYYGAQTDQYELAQIAGADAARGTDLDAMADSLRRLAGRLGVRTKVVYELDAETLAKTVEDYDRLAKRERIPFALAGADIPADKTFLSMEPFLLLQVRTRRKADAARFANQIKRAIDDGVPVLWAVILGVATEKGAPQAAGGHMRLIVGYDETRKHLIYSDSWGEGHEEKRISMEDAWAITTAAYVVQPIKP